MQIRVILTALLLAAGPTAGWADGQAPASQPDRSANPLANLPSPRGGHVADIEALGDNQWLALPPVGHDPKWGEARGRAWGGRSLTFAPDLRGAFFCGEGRHAWVKPDGYYMNDLWFYDIHVNRWICLNPGVPVKTVQLKLDEHGFEVDQQGEQTPLGFLGHAYGSTTYDRGRRKYVVIYANICYLNTVIKQRQAWLGVPPEKRNNLYATGKLNASAKHPLFWDVAAGRWERRFVSRPGGFDGSREDGVTQYIPSLRKTLFAIRDQVWLYDYQGNEWTGSAKTGCPLRGYENGCYDPKRERLYVAHGKQIAFYDVKAKRWTELKAEGQPSDFASTNTVCLNWDTANDVLLYTRNNFRGRAKAPAGSLVIQSAYLPEKDKWVQPPAVPFPRDKLPEEIGRYLHYAQLHGFYDEKLNAHFFYLAGDSGAGGAMVVYRYKRPKD